MKKLGKVIITLLIIILAAIMIFFSFEKNQISFIRYVDSFQGKEKEVVESIHMPGNGIRYINGRYLSWDGETIRVTDDVEKTLWERTFLLDQPLLDIEDNLIGVYDKNSGEAMVFNLNGNMLAQIEEDLPIFYFKPGKNGHLVHIREEARQLLKIYDINGNHEENLIFTKEFPIDYRLEENGAVVTLLELRDSGVATKVVSFGENGKDELISIDDRIIVKVIKIEDRSLIVADTGLYMHHKDQIVWGRDFQLLQDVFVDGRDIYVIYGDNLRIMDMDGNTRVQETFGMGYDEIHGHGKYIILRGDKDILVLQHMESVANRSFDTHILDIQSQFNDLVITTENGVTIMRIENKEVEEEEEEEQL